MGSSKTPPRVSLPLPEEATRIAVAFSGGLDSTVLLHSTVAAYGPEHVIALHVNHGLQDLADDWVVHCSEVARNFEVPFDFRLVQWDESPQDLSNVEAQARRARYDALVEMCHYHGVEHLLIGHHQDDQAETVLMQLIRGSGLLGLAAMPAERPLHVGNVRIWRPFLELTRRDLEAYATEYQLDWIEDPTNQDEQYTRNYLRLHVLPAIEKIQPQFRQNVGRAAAHLFQAQRLLDQLADIDLQVMVQEEGLHMGSIMSLRFEDPARSNNAIRRWLSLQQVSMPSEERLQAWWTDMENLKDSNNHQLTWLHDGKELKVWRQILSIHEPKHQEGKWVFMDIPAESDQPGVRAEILEEAVATGNLTERLRTGGEKMRLHPNRPRRTLKNLFQEFDIPPWQRGAPILFLGEEVLAVAGVGVNTDLLTIEGPRLIPQWVQVDAQEIAQTSH